MYGYGIVHKLAQCVDSEIYVRASYSEVDHLAQQSLIGYGVRQRVTLSGVNLT